MRDPVDYRRLGITPFINARGNSTANGGSLMPPQAVAAMQQAAGSYVPVDQLQVAVGRFIAERIGVAAACVTCGAASGVQQAAAACLTGVDRERVAALPHTEGWRNQFVVPMVDVHQYIYQLIAAVGGRVVGVGSMAEGVTPAEVAAATGEQTAAILFYLGPQPREQLQPMVTVAAAAGVPLLIDAAAQLPPRSNLSELVAAGVALAVFSGGKGLRGPQASGLVVGGSEMVEAVRLNGSPASSIGRGMKVGKEELLATAAAVDVFLAGSDAADHAEWLRRAGTVTAAVDDLPGVEASISHSGKLWYPTFTPRARIAIDDQSRIEALNQAMASGSPPIRLGGKPGLVFVDPMTLQPGEAEAVAERLRVALRLN